VGGECVHPGVYWFPQVMGQIDDEPGGHDLRVARPAGGLGRPAGHLEHCAGDVLVQLRDVVVSSHPPILLSWSVYRIACETGVEVHDAAPSTPLVLASVEVTGWVP